MRFRVVCVVGLVLLVFVIVVAAVVVMPGEIHSWDLPFVSFALSPSATLSRSTTRSGDVARRPPNIRNAAKATNIVEQMVSAQKGSKQVHEDKMTTNHDATAVETRRRKRPNKAFGPGTATPRAITTSAQEKLQEQQQQPPSHLHKQQQVTKI